MVVGAFGSKFGYDRCIDSDRQKCSAFKLYASMAFFSSNSKVITLGNLS